MELWTELVANSPYFAGFVFLIYKSLSYLKDRDRMLMTHEEKRDEQIQRFLAERDRSFQEVISKLEDDCHTVQRDATEAMRENTRMLGRVEQALSKAP